jgi:S-disulfanyl-L-cysteine oxidoreductase SoxD
MRGVIGSAIAVLAVVGANGQEPVGPTRSVREGVYTIAQAERGAPLYGSYCASCHASDLQGFTPTPVARVPALVGPRFIANWNALTVYELFERIRISMPQDRPGRLSRQENVDIVAFLLQASGYEPGAHELSPHDEAALRDIRVEP